MHRAIPKNIERVLLRMRGPLLYVMVSSLFYATYKNQYCCMPTRALHAANIDSRVLVFTLYALLYTIDIVLTARALVQYSPAHLLHQQTYRAATCDAKNEFAST